MRIRIDKDTTVLINDVYDVLRCLHEGEEYEVFPTNDGIKFEVLDKLISPYDIADNCSIID